MGKNLLQRQADYASAIQTATRETEQQFCMDIAAVVLMDEDIMGADAFDCEKLSKFYDAFSRTYGEFSRAIEKHVESDYYQQKLDDRLRDTIPADKVRRFSERYHWLRMEHYQKKKP